MGGFDGGTFQARMRHIPRIVKAEKISSHTHDSPAAKVLHQGYTCEQQSSEVMPLAHLKPEVSGIIIGFPIFVAF